MIINAEFPLVIEGDIISFDLELRERVGKYTVQVWERVEVFSSAADDPIGSFRCSVPFWLQHDCGFRRGLIEESLIYFCDVREVRFEDGRKWIRGAKEKSLRNQRDRSGKKPLAEDIKRVKVAGSKGGFYTVELGPDFVQCNCVGFGWRGHCRHVDLALKEIKDD